MDRFFTTDPLEDAIFSLGLAHRLLEKVSEDLLNWKWVILALHNSLQGFMACAIRGTNAASAIKDRTGNGRHVKNWLARRATRMPKLLNFLDLYDQIQSEEHMCRSVGSKRFEPTGEQTEEVKFLNNVRNELVHYFPSGRMNRDVAEWVQMIRQSTEVIKFLCLESENVFMPRDKEKKLKVGEILEGIQKQLDLIQAAIEWAS